MRTLLLANNETGKVEEGEPGTGLLCVCVYIRGCIPLPNLLLVPTARSKVGQKHLRLSQHYGVLISGMNVITGADLPDAPVMIFIPLKSTPQA